MNLLDVILVVTIAGSVILGYRTGLARTAIGFVAVVGGMLFGFWFYGIPAAWLHKYLSSATISNILGFIAVFCLFQLAGGILGKVLSKLFKWTGLSFFDRVLGGIFGVVRGSLLAVIMVAILMAFTPMPPPNWMVGSAVLPYAVEASDMCSSLAPKVLKDGVRNAVGEVRKAWEDQVKKAEKYRNKVKPAPAEKDQ